MWARTTLTPELLLVSESQGKEGSVLLEECQGLPVCFQSQSFPEPEAPPHKGHRTQVHQASIPPRPRLGRQTAHNPVGAIDSALDTEVLHHATCTQKRAHTQQTHTWHTWGPTTNADTHTEEHLSPNPNLMLQTQPQI